MSKIKASELLDYSRIQLHTPLGGLYEATVTTYAERDLVTIWTIPDNDVVAGLTLTCDPDTLIELVEAPTLHGRVQGLLRKWDLVLKDTAGDDQYVAANELYEELKEIAAHTVV